MEMNKRRKRKARVVALRWKQSAAQRQMIRKYAELQRIMTMLADDMARRIWAMQESFSEIFDQMAENFYVNMQRQTDDSE